MERTYKYLAVHCTAGPLHQKISDILAYWKNTLGWKNPGYHEIIEANGVVTELLPIEKVSNGVKGFNHETINICCVGGIDKNGNPVDNRTPEQIVSLVKIIKKYKARFPNIITIGHRDFSTDLNGNGIIERWEWIKACPGYDVRDWLKSIELEKQVKPSGIIYKLNYPLIKDDKVKEIQVSLKKAGFYQGNIDRIFGEKTDKAVRAFQEKNSLKVDGIVGTSTAKKLGIQL